MNTPILSHYQAAALLEAHRAGQATAVTSLDLELTTAEVTLTPDRLILPDQVVPWRELEEIARHDTACFVVENGRADSARPTLRLKARRGADTPAFRFKVRLHRALAMSGLVVQPDVVRHMAVLEALCDRAAAQIETPGTEALMALFSLAVRYSPIVASCVLNSLPELPAWPATELTELHRLAEDLESERFTARLACRWRRQPKLPGTVGVAWTTLEREISLYLTARITPSASLEAIRTGFDAATGDRIPADEDLDLFTREALRDLGRRLTARGVKSFAARCLPDAAGAFETALAYDVDSLWARWNLARLCLCQGRQLDALTHYEALQANLPPCDANGSSHARFFVQRC